MFILGTVSEAEILQSGQEVLQSITPNAILFELNERLEHPICDQPVIKSFCPVPRFITK